MNQITRLMVAAGMLSAVMLAGGCGNSDSSSSTASQSTPTTPTQFKAGTVAGTIEVLAGQTVTALAPPQSGQTGQVTALTLPAGTVLTPPAGSSFSAAAPPTISVSIPVDNATTAASGLPLLTNSGGTKLTVASSKGAVDISLAGVSSFTATPPVTVNIPVNAVLTNPVTVYRVKADGTTTQLTGTYFTDVNGNKIVSLLVSDFCWFIVNPTFVTGSFGGTPL